MGLLDIIALGLSAAALTAAAGIFLYNRGQTRRLIASLSRMLDSAIDGSFNEKTFDESAMSALEARLGRYLSVSALSAKNLALEKEKIKSLISDISHQTKTPLANILLYSELLAEQDELPVEIQKMISQISGQSEKLKFLLDALVKISRLETGIIVAAPRQNSIANLIRSAIEEILPKAGKKNIAIVVGDTEGTACFDMKWTCEALFNILDNAVKYTPVDGEINIIARLYGFFTRIDVSDTGIGIEEGELNKIFARFYRSANSYATDGVGIGLFLAREIVSSQRGYILVASRVGQGSTFSVFLPRECA